MMRLSAVLVFLLLGCSRGSPKAGDSTTPSQTPTSTSPDGDVIVVAPDDETAPQERPWGTPVADAAQEALAIRLLEEIGQGKAKPEAISEVFFIGPALYAALLELDREKKRKQIETIGVPSVAAIPIGGGKIQKLDMRSYLEPQHRVEILAATSFRAFGLALSDGKARAATEAERQTFFTFIPFSIADKPVTVVEHSGNVVVVCFENGKLMWVDVLSDYSR